MSPELKPLKWYKNLSERKGRLEAGAFIVEGEKAISQVLSGHPGEILEILAVEEPSPQYRNYECRLLTESQYRSISSSQTPQGIMAVVKSPEGIYSDRLPAEIGTRILMLEDIQDPGNTGTLIRTASAFGYSGIIMTEKCSDPLSPKCVQSTAGSILSVWIRRTVDYLELVDELKDSGFTLVAAVLDGSEEISILKQNKNLLLALGNEASGLSPELIGRADYRIRIPVARENAESLNVAVCGGICMYLSVKNTE
jgi:RNA methyltransferase, TrmH family